MPEKQAQTEVQQVIEKISAADSILIALSKNPNIDEISSAIGLAMFIDVIGKHATAIYSGQTPNVLEFLNPEQRLETNTNSLQDFIVAINKDKADHLRYKLEDDYVKVYITPYKTTISEDDLEFSHGDYNVNLVIGLNIQSADDLDAALSEYGRIMHDASIINISTSAPGKFGEIQWLNPTASSIAEMIADLVFRMKGDSQLGADVSTALLTGIVSATDRFSNNRTQPETMSFVSKLMSEGANQQLISANFIKEEEPKSSTVPVAEEDKTGPDDETVLNVIRDSASSVATELDKAPSDGLDMASKNDNVEPQAEVVDKPVSEVVPSSTDGGQGEIPGGNDALIENPQLQQAVSGEPESNVPDFLTSAIQEASPAGSNSNGENTGSSSDDMSSMGSGSMATVIQPLNNDFAPPSVPSFSGVSEATEMPVVQNSEQIDGLLTAMPESKSEPIVSGSNDLASGISNGENFGPGIGDVGSAQNNDASGPNPGVDYGSMIDAALAGEEVKNDKGDYIGVNPALAATPGVSDTPEINNLPDMSFDKTVDDSANVASAQGNQSYINDSSMNVVAPSISQSSTVEMGSDLSGDVDGDSLPESTVAETSTLPMPDSNAGFVTPAPSIDFSSDSLPKVELSDNPEIKPLSDQEGNAPVFEAPASPAVPNGPGDFKIPGM